MTTKNKGSYEKQKEDAAFKKETTTGCFFFIDIPDYAGALVDTRKNTFPFGNVSAERVFSALSPFF